MEVLPVHGGSVMSDDLQMHADGLGATYKGPVIAEVIIKDKFGQPLFHVGEQTVEPGQTVSWEYPTGGIKVFIS